MLDKKFLTGALFLLSAIVLQGCSSAGMVTAPHNGKKYWNPGNCSQYKYYNNNPDRLHCVSNGKENGVVVEPVGQQQLENHYRKQEMMNRAAGTGGGSYYNSPSNTVNCYRMGDFSFNKEIRTFNGMVCPMGWLRAF